MVPTRIPGQLLGLQQGWTKRTTAGYAHGHLVRIQVPPLSPTLSCSSKLRLFHLIRRCEVVQIRCLVDPPGHAGLLAGCHDMSRLDVQPPIPPPQPLCSSLLVLRPSTGTVETEARWSVTRYLRGTSGPGDAWGSFWT